jgi:hypothetical protein
MVGFAIAIRGRMMMFRFPITIAAAMMTPPLLHFSEEKRDSVSKRKPPAARVEKRLSRWERKARSSSILARAQAWKIYKGERAYG